MSDQLTGNLKQGLSKAAVFDEIPSKCFSLPSPLHIFFFPPKDSKQLRFQISFFLFLFFKKKSF